MRDLPDQAVVGKLFETIAPRFAGRPGGYTRIIRLGFRRGDSAELAQVELVGSEYDPKAAAKQTKTAEAPKPKKGVGDRIRAAAERLRGKKEDADDKAARGASTKGAKTAKRTTPQKSG
jgi:large subunit ribosomal protein L17